MIAADREFHDFIHELSGSPLIAPAMQAQWTYAQRLMGEVLMRDEKPRDIWDRHEAMRAAVMDGGATTAEKPARRHVTQAATFILTRLRSQRKDAAAAA
ncbi:MAG: FCD domain-containing protein [Proteobacteria bacterium]|nr:FCD domain-containing protein [Pseudomonadota bacterium]